MLKKIGDFFLCVLILMLCFFWDSQIPFLLTDIVTSPFLVTTHFVLISLIIWVHVYQARGAYLIFFVIGIIHDSFYFQSIPVASLVYPLLVFVTKRHAGLLTMMFTRALMLLVFVFLFDATAYGMAWLYGITKLSLEHFIVYNMMPSLMFNFLLILMLDAMYHRFYKKA